MSGLQRTIPKECCAGKKLDITQTFLGFSSLNVVTERRNQTAHGAKSMVSAANLNDALLTGAAESHAQFVAQPVGEKERIVSIDVLRGFALLGILAMNIQAFSMVSAAYTNPTVSGDLHGANYAVWFVCHLFLDLKMMSIFSMLFGAGIYLMASHVEASGRPAAALHYRRMGWLILFGLLHGFLLWYGDILYDYGVCGLLIFIFRKRQPKTLLILGTLTLAVVPVVLAGFGHALKDMSPRDQALNREQVWQPTPAQIADENADYRGGWRTQMRHRGMETVQMKTVFFVAFSFWREAGLMLIGIALFKLEVFSAKRPAWLYWWMVVVGALVGLPIVWYGAQRAIASGWSFPGGFLISQQSNYVGSLFVCFAWVGVIMLACKSAALLPVTRRLAAVGRMALSNYIFHTLACTTLFYGHGFGWFGNVQRTGQFGIVLAIWAFQLIVSPIWLRYFYFGPLEWLWRSLTYWQLEPFHRTANAIA
jgi:uncharacterized protein